MTGRTLSPLTCSVDGCTRAARTRGWCVNHYARWRRNGHTDSFRDRDCFDKLMEKVEARGDCLEYMGIRDRRDYGRVFLGVHSRPRTTGAHRVVYEHFHGPIGNPALLVMHSCDNPPCVKIEHLSLGTHADNSADMASKGRGVGIRNEASYRAKLTDAEVAAIRSRSSEKRKDLAAEFGVDASTITKIVLGRRRPVEVPS